MLFDVVVVGAVVVFYDGDAFEDDVFVVVVDDDNLMMLSLVLPAQSVFPSLERAYPSTMVYRSYADDVIYLFGTPLLSFHFVVVNFIFCYFPLVSFCCHR